MRKFTDNQPLLDNVKANNLDEVKRILTDNIFFLQGDQLEINKAIKFAINNCDFNFEKHQELPVSDKANKEDYFSYEKWNLSKNYSRERYDLLVDLYHATFANQEYTYQKDIKSGKGQILRKVVIGGVIIIVGYLIYKALN